MSTEKEWELWEIVTEHWTLPVDVTWTNETLGIIEPSDGVLLLEVQRKALQEVLDAFGWSADGRSWITRANLKQIARRSRRENPEHVVRWTPCDYIAPELDRETAEEAEFIEGFCAAGFIKSEEAAVVIWRALCKHMLNWVLVKNRVLDLKFCRISALPFRPNWKSVALSAISSLNLKEFHKSDTHAKAWVKEMLRPEKLYVSRASGNILRSLDIVPCYWYWTNAIAVEKLRRDQAKDGYWNLICGMMKAAIPYAWTSFISYLQEIRHPFPFTSDGGDSGDTSIPENWHRVESDVEAAIEPDLVPDSIDRRTWKEQGRCAERLDPEKEGLPEVPDI